MRRRPTGQRPIPTGPRINHRIRISPVFVLLEDGTRLGEMDTDDARAKARELGLDLVEVSPNARPPVCKIIDHGKWKFEQSKKRNEAKKNQTRVEIKQIKMRPKTDDHDIDFKAKHARRFLDDGNKVQFQVRFRGRENAHPEMGRVVLNKIMKELIDVARVETAPRYENKIMTMMIGPK